MVSTEKKFSLLRIAFGFVWLVDAVFKWQPAFFNNIHDTISQAISGQPVVIQAWISFWAQLVNINPHLFALLIALAETGIAVGLIFGIFTRVALVGGIVLGFVIWSTAEGFGGPYAAGSTDIGSAVIYIFVSIALLLGHSWKELSLDHYFWAKKEKFHSNAK